MFRLQSDSRPALQTVHKNLLINPLTITAKADSDGKYGSLQSICHRPVCSALSSNPSDVEDARNFSQEVSTLIEFH
jgi:hypothetical protein